MVLLYFCAFYFKGPLSLQGTGFAGILGCYQLKIGISQIFQLGESPRMLVKNTYYWAPYSRQAKSIFWRGVEEYGFSTSIPENSASEKHLLEISGL